MIWLKLTTLNQILSSHNIQSDIIKEELKEIIAAGLPSWDEYNRTVGENKAYAIMEQEIQDLQKDYDGDTKT